MKRKEVKFKSIEFDEISGDTGLIHHQYTYDHHEAGDILSWFRDGKFQTSYSGAEMRTKIRELMN